MKQRYFLLFKFITIVISSSFGQFYPVNTTSVSLKKGSSTFNETKVESFSISNLITVKEFNIYLLSIEKDSSVQFYNAQFPTSKKFDKDLAKKILSDPTLQNEPMPGISWTVARNYCRWLTNQSIIAGQKNVYDLPTVAEVIAFNQLYQEKALQNLEIWALNAFDESLSDFSKSLNYQYNAKQTDPSSMKRKVFLGGSYHMNFEPNESYRAFLYEYQDSSSRYIGFRIVKRNAVSTFDSLTINNLRIEFGINNNHLDGIYQERYLNGKLKVLGNYTNGQRTDVWTVWDSLGTIKVQRNYVNNKVCEFLYPLVHNPYATIYNSHPEYILKKNEQSIYPYLFVEERAVIYSQRCWRELTLENEPEFFQKIDLKNLIQEILKTDLMWFHYGESGNLKTVLTKDEIQKLEVNSTNWDYKRMEVKEDFFFSTEQLMGETRALAISFYANEDDQNPSYSIYFPQLRVILGKMKLTNSSMSELKTIDDLFFFHSYRGKITNCGYVFNNSKETNSGQTSFYCELEKMTKEHDLWLIFGR